MPCQYTGGSPYRLSAQSLHRSLSRCSPLRGAPGP